MLLYATLSTKLNFAKSGDWGYNTQKEREEAASIHRIRILELSDFSKKLK